MSSEALHESPLRWQSWLNLFRRVLRGFVITVPIYFVGIALLDRLLSPHGVPLGTGVIAVWAAAIVVWIVMGFAVKNSFRFGVRSLFIATTIFAFLCFLPVYFVRPYLAQQRAITILQKAGVRYATASDAPPWLQRCVGSKNCQVVTSVEAHQRSSLDDELLECLSGSADLRELFIGDSLITDNGLKHLQGMTNIAVLDLPSNDNVSNACFVYLPAMKQLRWIDASDVPVKDEGLAYLSTLTQLNQIELNRAQITDKGLEHLKSLTGLRRLVLDKNPITDAGLKNLKPLAKLEVLSLQKTAITDKGLAHIEGCKKLRVLKLSDTRITDAGVASLSKLTSLAVLDLDDTQVTSDGLKPIQAVLPRCEIFHQSWPQFGRGRQVAERESNGYYMYQADKKLLSR